MATTLLLRRSQMFFPFKERVFRIFPHYPAWNTARNRDLWVIKVIDFSLQLLDFLHFSLWLLYRRYSIVDSNGFRFNFLHSCRQLISFICALNSPRIPWMQSITEPGSWSLFPAVDAVFWQLFFLWRYVFVVFYQLHAQTTKMEVQYTLHSAHTANTFSFEKSLEHLVSGPKSTNKIMKILVIYWYNKNNKCPSTISGSYGTTAWLGPAH